MTKPPAYEAPVPTTGPVLEGFTGTLAAFLAWLHEQLAYGGVAVGPPRSDEHRNGRLIHEVELVTAGYSDDESLIGRVSRGSLFALMFWESTHRGGLEIFHVPADQYLSEETSTWLEPATDVFQEVHRARTLVVTSADGNQSNSFDFPHGVALSFSEPERSIADPAGVVTATHLEPFVWPSRQPATETSP